VIFFHGDEMQSKKDPKVKSRQKLAKFVREPLYQAIIRNVCARERVVGVEADDIVQEVTTNALTKLTAGEGIRNIFNFASATARGLMQNHRRTRKKHSNVDQEPHLEAFNLRPCDKLAESEESFLAAIAGHALPPDQRAILKPQLHGLSPKQIADVTGTPLRNVYRMQKDIKEQLTAYVKEPDVAMVHAFDNVARLAREGCHGLLMSDISHSKYRSRSPFIAASFHAEALFIWQVAFIGCRTHRFFFGFPRLRPFISMDSECSFHLISIRHKVALPLPAPPKHFRDNSTNVKYFQDIHTTMLEFGRTSEVCGHFPIDYVMKSVPDNIKSLMSHLSETCDYCETSVDAMLD
jgi:RNA polymerase sigma factor (sigma-70 family)